MRKLYVLVLLGVLPCAISAQKKSKELPLPPTVSHGLQISNYACNFAPTSQTRVDYWNVTGFAEYGPNHKRYWTKSLGTFSGTESVSSSTYNASIDTGDVSGASDMISAVGKYGEAGKKCAEWKGAVHDFLVKALGQPQSK